MTGKRAKDFSMLRAAMSNSEGQTAIREHLLTLQTVSKVPNKDEKK